MRRYLRKCYTVNLLHTFVLCVVLLLVELSCSVLSSICKATLSVRKALYKMHLLLLLLLHIMEEQASGSRMPTDIWVSNRGADHPETTWAGGASLQQQQLHHALPSRAGLGVAGGCFLMLYQLSENRRLRSVTCYLTQGHGA